MDPLAILVQDRISQLHADARRARAPRAPRLRRVAVLLHRLADRLDRPGTVDTGMATCGPIAGAR